MDELVFPREFTRVARWRADRSAVVDHGTGTRTSFAEHHTRVARLCGALHDRLGLRPGDRFSALRSSLPELETVVHAVVELSTGADLDADAVSSMRPGRCRGTSSRRPWSCGVTRCPSRRRARSAKRRLREQWEETR
ncbi:hypothetical protein [Pseudonocardia endophytica]|uniref:AMP-binding enzyme n=1 Tax=Pseudonocardia endophytica TaxID=401976 RepID=A0A4R1HPI1_PSEEN|nr:hypothetical protein [Pseudonocardia endophytica]TCK24454.1 AMP-binding enzyme [Pseudonocardia endophytica]